MLDVYNLKGTYLFNGKKGTQNGKIYLNPENNFIGDLLDTGEKFLACGILTDEKLSFFKVSENKNFSAVFWYLQNKNGNELNYKGDFFFLNYMLSKKREMYTSIEISLEAFKNKDFTNIDKIILQMFNESKEPLEELIKKQPFRANGSGKIILTKI